MYDGRKSDVWSVGVMLYKMISSRYPFGSDSTDLFDLIDAICFDELAYLDDSSLSINHLIKNLLEKKPEKRMFAIYCLQHPWFTRTNLSKAKRNSSFI